MRILQTLLGWALVSASLGAAASDLYVERMQSKSLGREYRYSVHLPDRYATSKLRYPVLYLLPGGNNDESSWAAKGNIQSLVDGLIARNEIPPLVVVMPGHYRGYWVDGQAERAESAVIQDLVPHVDRLNWPTHLPAYVAGKTIVPIYIASGDHDRLDIAYASAVLYRALRQVQPEAVELRVVDGDHEWDAWQSQIAEGLRYINRYLVRPEMGD